MLRVRRSLVIAFVTTVLAGVSVQAGAAFGLFGHCCPRLNANETSAIATLRNLHSAQAQFHRAVGRYGTFPELSAAAPLKETGHPLDPPVLSGAFSRPLSDRTVLRFGYRFRIELDGETWQALAWPDPRLPKSRRTFLVSGSTRIVQSTVDERHEGDRGPTDPDDHVWVEVL